MKEDTTLARWLAGELDQAELKALQDSPKYNTLLRIKENFRHLQNPDFKEREMLEEILRQEKKAALVIPLYRKYWKLVAAASIILLLGIGFTFTMPKELSASNGETYAFALPDQSEVILNAGSSVSYKGWNWDNNRKINLDGEAYFKVAKGKKFSVETSLGTVSVLGTQFNVRARDNRLDVVCYEGKVSVRYNGKETILTPHKTISVQNGIVNQNINTNDSENPQWLHDELVFADEKFEGVIEEIERQYNVIIVTDYTSSQLFNGSIPGNNLDAALKSVSVSYHLQVIKKADRIILKPL